MTTPLTAHAVQGAPHLTAQELADRLSVPLKTTYYWRSIHQGPPSFRVGKFVRYRLEDVIAWEKSQLALNAKR